MTTYTTQPMQSVADQLTAESKLTPYFGESWLMWLRERAGPQTRSRVDDLIETIDMSNEVYAEYLRSTMGRDVVPIAPLDTKIPADDDRKVVVFVLNNVLRPNLHMAYKALDPEVEDKDWAEAFRVLQHARALVFVTEEVLKEMDVRIGKRLLRMVFLEV